MEPSITAIVVSYNSVAMLPRCVGALREHLAPEQVLVVDNASTDASVDVARGLGTDVIANRVNLGYGTACNIAARQASTDLLLFINPDVCITSVDMAKLSQIATRRPLGLVAPRVLLAADSGHEEFSTRRVMPWPCNIAREALGPVLPRKIARRLFTLIDTPGAHSWLSAALLLCARTEFLALGGFDERFFLYYEDQELSRRYEAHRLPLSVTDAINGQHVRGGSSATHDVARSIPCAASAMSSVELVSIVHGQRSGRLAWALYGGFRRCASGVARLMAWGPLPARGTRKLSELYGTQDAIRMLVEGSRFHYPHVKELTRGRKQ